MAKSNQIPVYHSKNKDANGDPVCVSMHPVDAKEAVGSGHWTLDQPEARPPKPTVGKPAAKSVEDK